MKILGIETSCDETSAAVLTDGSRILSGIVLSQDEIHAPYGGVVPELASRRHILSIGYVVEEALRRANLSLDQIDVFAVTQGPGLIGSLLVGLSFAKGLAYYRKKPLIPVDHLEAHVQSAFIENPDIPFPSLALLVSGGHTTLFFLKEKRSFEILGKTRDDAAGEAMDKIAKFLGLGYPGGPVIDRLAEGGNAKQFPFAVPRMRDKSLDYSFSGLKTAALRHIKVHRINGNHAGLPDFLASFQRGIIKALLANLSRALREYRPQSLILCGGVARNRALRHEFEKLADRYRLHAYIPAPELCTDNAVMVAALALEKINSGESLRLDMDLNAYPRRSF
ncbi:MAG: tRNA (adenosine(37)-N6)-threonylcarbamoyltransferase complex transferase subunit TsaD [Candidatus Aminicenantes bacterium]|nr:tRNA (adenosine(37)-N6)-threonylcarbamoyltransferase complex transferase subunit TsaD [Candidatus Aminicenantes bacterium]